MTRDSKKREIVDILLEYKGTPRRHLYEYPYNQWDSERILAAAYEAAEKILDVDREFG